MSDSKSRYKRLRRRKEDPIEITVKLDGLIYLGESEVEIENLIPRLNAITDQNTEARIYVRGDKNINYGRVLEVMGTLSGAGFSKVALISEPYKN